MRIIMIVFLLLGMISCTEKNAVPDGVIPPSKMEKVLWDMMLADRFSTLYILKDSAKLDEKAETFKMYDRVFQVHGVDKETFTKSFRYYMERPDLTKIIMDSISQQAARKRSEVYIPVE